MKKRIAKKWFKGAPPVGEASLAPSRAHLARVREKFRHARTATERAVSMYEVTEKKLEGHLNGARNYEEWARLQMFSKDVVIKELQDRIDWFVSQSAIKAQMEAPGA